ncbi:MAG: hypothetical protein F4Z77_06890 [Dehalococcoidia bacterium]|nr:hypothetical protein [Dehalococcoidia bacterium]MYA54445.1 hypothetical protein [Dehalococcoidia bacterium]
MPPPPEEELEIVFPGLSGVSWEVASPQDTTYNCVAFAIGEVDRWWWPLALPASGGYWPQDSPRAETLEAFRATLQGRGFMPVEDEALVEGVSKLALFARSARVVHVAVQREDGRWASKLGTQWDIVHPLRALEGEEYGSVAAILARPTR